MAQSNRNSSESIVRDIKRNTRRHFSAEDKIRIILDGLRGEYSVVEVCRREGIHASQYYKWSKDFMEAGKKRLNGDTEREANTSDVKGLRDENEALKQLVAEISLKNRVLKKSLTGLA